MTENQLIEVADRIFGLQTSEFYQVRSNLFAPVYLGGSDLGSVNPHMRKPAEWLPSKACVVYFTAHNRIGRCEVRDNSGALVYVAEAGWYDHECTPSVLQRYRAQFAGWTCTGSDGVTRPMRPLF
jgi:hypothetical protein